MAESTGDREARQFSKNAMTAFLHVGAVVLVAFWCFRIIAPFISLVTWGLIIAVTMHPVHLRFANVLGGSQKQSATLLVLLGLALLLAPTWVMLESSVDSARGVATELRDGTLSVPPPNADVAEWPLVGKRIYAIWNGASENLQETLQRFDTQLATFGETLLRNLGSAALGVLQFVGAIIVAGIFLVSGEPGYRLSRAIASNISPSRGTELVDLSIATIRSVTKGVLGVAFVQTALAVLGLVVMGVPGTGIWGAIVLMLAVMQLPPWLVLAPIAVWVFSVAAPLPATIFAVYSLLVSVSDMFLKPLFLGRGVDVPMPVVLIGAIGGALSAGVVGLFVGAVILAIGYVLLIAWIYPDVPPAGAEAKPVE